MIIISRKVPFLVRMPSPYRLQQHTTTMYRIAIAIATVFTLAAANAASARELPWESATEHFSTEEINAIVRENSSASGTQIDDLASAMQVYEIENDLYLVNFNSRLLCGRGGCLYAMYHEDDRQLDRVFYNYLTATPRGVPLLEIDDREQNDLPCLTFNQLDPSLSQLNAITLCFDGEQYQQM